MGDEGENIVEQIEVIAGPARRFLAESVIRDTTRSPLQEVSGILQAKTRLLEFMTGI